MKLPPAFLSTAATVATLVKKSCGPAENTGIADPQGNSYGVHAFNLCSQDELITGLVNYCGAKKLGTVANALSWPNVKNLTGSGNWLTAAGNVSSAFLGCALNGTQTQDNVDTQASNWALTHELLPFMLVGVPSLLIFGAWAQSGFPLPSCTKRRPDPETHTLDHWPS